MSNGQGPETCEGRVGNSRPTLKVPKGWWVRRPSLDAALQGYCDRSGLVNKSPGKYQDDVGETTSESSAPIRIDIQVNHQVSYQSARLSARPIYLLPPNQLESPLFACCCFCKRAPLAQTPNTALSMGNVPQ